MATKLESLEVAKHAWTHAVPGVNEDMLGHTVVRLSKVVLVMPKLEEIRKTLRREVTDSSKRGIVWSHIVAFPKPEHVGQFINAIVTTAVGGPAYEYPGSVGVVQIRFSTTGNPVIELDHAQSSFKAGIDKYNLPRKLATYYAGWRKHALEEVIKLAKETHTPIEVRRSNLYLGKSTDKVSGFHQDLLDLCKKHELKVLDGLPYNEDLILINPPTTSKRVDKK